jgi:hypothetical protein
MDPDDFLSQLSIRIMGLASEERKIARKKLRALSKARAENLKLEDQVARLETIAAGKRGLPPGTRVILKLYNDATKQTLILKVNSSESVDHVRTLAARKLGRLPLLSVQISDSHISLLTATTLIEAYTQICRGVMETLTIIAL